MSWFAHLPISRVSIKLSFVLIVGGFLIFGAYGWYELNTERHALRRGVEQETTLLSSPRRSLACSRVGSTSTTDRITRIVEQLLRFTRRRSAPLARHDVGPALRNVVDLMQHEAQRRGVFLALEIPQPMPTRWVDTDEIQQIVLNLIANALAATSRGGRVTVRVEASHLAPRSGGPEGPAVRLVVADTGCGVAPNVQARLFEPFFTTRAAEGGTGLGLAVVKSLVTDHGGTITVASTPGVGSEFAVTLPVYSAALQREAS